ncbi:hypothetical protein PSHT_02454 [Puccinia striiformis]|uniref:Uncharacterized protein n=1 Tax=Puccinia striiformis TaxID=27350 RepID=A0A2S4WI32_9BASI|nr:hypothetical protein PSHT_02454 [Puccinia striiformis]
MAASVGPPPQMVKIQNEDRDLGFDGTNIEEFLYWYQEAAKEDGASEDDMAQQLGCFVLNDDLLNIVETLEGYEPPNWPKLKMSMLAYWGRVKIPRFSQPFDNSKAMCSVSDSDEENTCPMILPKPVLSQSSVCFESDISNDRLNTIDGGLRKIDYLRVSDIVEYESPVIAQPVVEGRKTSLFRCRAQTEFIDEEKMAAKLEPSNQSIEDPGETVVPLSIPMPVPIQPCLYRPEACVEKVVENSQLDVLDDGLCEIPNVKVSDVAVSESLEEFITLVSDLPLRPCPLGFLTYPIPNDQPAIKVTIVGERILPLDLIELQIKMPLSPSQVKTKFKVLEESSKPKHFLDSTISLTLSCNRQEVSDTTKIIKELATPLSCYRSGPISFESAVLRDEHKLLSSYSGKPDTSLPDHFTVFKLEKDQDWLFQQSLQGGLRNEDKLPSFCFEDNGILFSDRFSKFHFKEDQDLSFQDSLQDFLREEDKLLSFHLKADVLFQEPAPSFQDPLRNEGKLLSFQVVCGQGTSIGCQRIRERGLISVEAERLEVSPLLSVHLRVDTPQFVKTLCPATFVSHAWPPFSFTRLTLLLPTIIDHRGEIGQPLFYFEKSYDEFDQSHCARCWNEAPKTAIFLRFLGSQQSSASSSLPLHVFPLLSSYSLIASDITSRFELENDLTNNNINDRTTAPHSHNAPSLATDLIGFRSAFITPASELTKGDINIKPQSAIFSTQYLPSQEQSKMIRNLSRASNSHGLLYLNDFLDYCLYSLSQAYYSASFASNSSVPTSEAHCGLSWNRSGIGPNHVFPSEDCLRNEDKLPSFCLNSRGPFPAEALLTKSKSSQICVASSG